MTMTNENEVRRREDQRQRGLTVETFCDRYGIGRSKFYEERAAGRIKARRIGKRLIVTDTDAEEWFNALPVA